MNCTKCGAPLNGNDAYCQNCGSPINNNSNFSENQVSENNNEGFSANQQNGNLNNGFPQNQQNGNFNNGFFQNQMNGNNGGFNPSSSFNGSFQNSNNNKMIIIVGTIVIAIVVALLFIFVFNKDSSNNNPSNNGGSQVSNGGTGSSQGNSGTAQPISNTYKSTIGDYEVDVPTELRFEKETNSTMFYDSTNIWATNIYVANNSYDTYRANFDTIKTSAEENGIPISNLRETSENGVKFITFEVIENGYEVLYGITKADNNNSFMMVVVNSEGGYDYSIIKKFAPILSSAKKSTNTYNGIKTDIFDFGKKLNP